jgi:hypothetical protein
MYKEKPWLKFYEPHVPEHIDYPHSPIPATLEETARKHPDHAALIFKDNVTTQPLITLFDLPKSYNPGQ